MPIELFRQQQTLLKTPESQIIAAIPVAGSYVPTNRGPTAPPKVETKFNSAAYLETIESYSDLLANRQGSKVRIWIPHLPESLDLSRDSEFMTSNNMAAPDGLAIYERTQPQEIPVEFSLHAHDPLCVEGSQTLLDMAARLFSLVLPASVVDGTGGRAASTIPNPDAEPSLESQQYRDQDRADLGNLQAVFDKNKNTLKFPPACRLVLIQANQTGFGIRCVGYVKAARVKLRGPWLQTASGDAFNLPSAADFSFTFVHNPYYTNGARGKFVNAYGPDILNYLYNTIHISQLAENTYADIDQLALERRIPG